MNTHPSTTHLAFAILLTAVLTIPLSARADIKTGQHLIDKLNTPPATTEDRIEGMQLIGHILFAWEGKSHCKPPQATVGQAVAITRKFLNENPTLWHYDARNLVGAALGLAWPCPEKKESK